MLLKLFSISIILKYHKLEDLIIEKKKIFINYNDNKEEIIKLYICHLFNF